MRVPGTGQSVFGDPTKTGGFGGERHGIGIEAVSIRCRCILLTEARARACVIFQHASIPKITLHANKDEDSKQEEGYFLQPFRKDGTNGEKQKL